MLIDKLINYLKRENIKYKSDDEMVIFYSAEKKLVFYFNKEDAYYFRLMSPNLITVDANAKEQYLEIINEINLNYKVGKLAITNNNVWSFVEQFAYSEENVDVLFERCIKVIEQMVDEFNREIKKISDTGMKEDSPNEAQKLE